MNYLDRLKDGLHKNISVHSFLMEDNPALSEEYKEHLKTIYTGIWYSRFVLGQWVLAEGVIYANFDIKKHVLARNAIPTKMDRYYISCDYGITNPHVYLLIGEKMEQGKLVSYVIKEYYNNGKTKDGGHKVKTDLSFHDDYLEFKKDYPIYDLIIDPSAASLINYFKTKGIYCKQANNKVLEGISNVSTLLALNEIRISEDCTNLIEEFQTYTWDSDASKNGNDTPLKVADHCLTGDTMVDTIDGPIAIKDLVGKTGIVNCYDEINKIATVSYFEDVRMTRKNEDIYELELEDGRIIRATGDHLILTQRGWVELLNLTDEDDVIDIGGEL